ncbi:MAG: phosphatidate cytidylyltransferase, partial [Proteobacteria bacterium]|nr:phosphatidate cytidylyltransferase [Pseudomonadota bacterium]
FANDTGAFYTGTFFGKHKLAPNISPNKTIEGSVGGILTSMVAGFVFSFAFFDNFTLALHTLPCSFLMAVAGQIGDLFESAMKRASNIKDSGRILPGHGGMLDRIDGLLLAIPVLYVYLVFLI